MLSTSRVVEALTDPEPLIRYYAIHYFKNMRTRAPFDADHVLRLIESVPNRAERRDLDSLLETVSMTTATAQHVADRLASRSLVEREERSYRHIALSLSPKFLPAVSDQIEGCSHLDFQFRRRLRTRVDMLSVPTIELWDRLLDSAEELDDAEGDKREEGLNIAEDIAWAIGPKAADVREQVLATLSDPDIIDWREVFATGIAEQSADPVFIQPLAIKLSDPDGGDYVFESAQRYFWAIGSDDAVDALEQSAVVYRDCAFFHYCILASIKTQKSLEALRRLLSAAKDFDVAEAILESIALAGSDDPADLNQMLEIMRENEGRRPGYMSMPEMFLAITKLCGFDFPEWGEWKTRYEKQIFLDYSEQSGRPIAPHKSALPREITREAFGLDQFEDEMPANAAAIGYVTGPIRGTPKIGRNDPCPCGSKKKFKKCCGE